MIFNSKLNISKFRDDFPILSKNIIYFDNACMSLKPVQVVNKINEYYNEYPSCAGRSAHKLSERLGTEILKSRMQIKNLIGAKEEKEIIFTRNTTEGINLVANSFGLISGDEVIISDKEHNSNLVPWLKMKNKRIKLVVVETNKDNTFNIENFKKAFSKKTKLVSITQRSNLDGVTNPIGEIAKITHENNAKLLVDGAQSVPGIEVNVKKLNIDFLSFSGHKMLGPTGTGVLYGKKELLEKLDQFIVGGETVIDSTYEDYKVEELPNRFEAGLQDYANILGFGEAAKYLQKVGFDKIEVQENKLNKLITESLIENKKIKLIGPKDPELRAGIFSFNIQGMDMHHVSGMLNASKSIMLRSGRHCVHSWFNKHNIDGSVRASLYFYNTEEEANIFVDEVKKLCKM